jgi:hypothetical protein
VGALCSYGIDILFGTLVPLFGTLGLKTAYVLFSTFASLSEWMVARMARMYFMRALFQSVNEVACYEAALVEEVKDGIRV